MAPIPKLSASPEPVITTLLSIALSLAAYRITASLVPLLGPDLVAKGLSGADMLKPGFTRAVAAKTRQNGKSKPSDENEPRQEPVVLPEATGVIGASVYILLLTLCAPVPYLSHLLSPASPSGDMHLDLAAKAADNALEFPHHSFATYLACLLNLLMATFLGFMDDVFDIRWRFKIAIPVIASVPLLVTYAAGNGVTDIVLPTTLGLRRILGVEGTSGVIHLGPLYYLYMSLLSTFCTNSINIIAGVNGVEAGQALVIALSIAVNDLLYISFDISPILAFFTSEKVEPWIVGAGLARGSAQLEDRHLFSLYFMLPLAGVCLGLLRHNWYPAKAFIGDTLCYFTGMAFAVVGILGHFSKTLLLFFLPQVFNFIYSTPQLFGLLPCPRHRLPRLNESTGLLEPSFASLSSPVSRTQRALLTTLEALRLVRLERADKGRGDIVAYSNLTILNLILLRVGPMHEESLTLALMGVQVCGSAVAMGIRHGGASLFYDPAIRR